MDPFEVRMQFVSLLSRLTSSQSSISKVSHFALKHAPKCADDIWDCLVDECAQLNLNARINLLYFLDSLVDVSATTTVAGRGNASYRELVRRDLAKLVALVVPHTKEGNLNLISATQVLKSWRTRRLLDADLLDSILNDLDGRRESIRAGTATSSEVQAADSPISRFSKRDILQRIEDDRERHKRLREKIWVLPVPTSLLPTTTAPHPAPPAPNVASHPISHSHPGTAPPSMNPSPISPASPSELLPAKMRAKLRGPGPPGTMQRPPTPVPTPPPALVAGLPAGPVAMGPEVAIAVEFEQLWEAGLEERVGRGVQGGVKWQLEETDLAVMKAERERCFGPT